MESEPALDIPPAWEKLRLEGLRGIIMVVGAPDTGKTTFTHFLFNRLQQEGGITAYLDGDPGQSSLGPPATLTLALSRPVIQAHPRQGPTWRYFIGAVSPRGHMLPTLTGAARLVQAGREAGAQTILYDTSGFVDASHGGLALKLAKVELLRPVVLVAIQHEGELEPLLFPLRKSGRARIVTLHPSPAVRRRRPEARRDNRAAQFAHYFEGAKPLQVDWAALAVFPFPRFSIHRLTALEDPAGFALELGIVLDIDRASRKVTLLTPLPSLEGVNALRLGDLLLDPETFREEKLG